MVDIAYRGDGTGRPTSIPLPPARAPLFRGFRMRKSWRYVGVWSESVSACAARVRVGRCRRSSGGSGIARPAG